MELLHLHLSLQVPHEVPGTRGWVAANSWPILCTAELGGATWVWLKALRGGLPILGAFWKFMGGFVVFKCSHF